MAGLWITVIGQTMEDLTFADKVECFWCYSPKVRLEKLVGWGPKMGVVFHYKFKCMTCRRRAMIPRNKQNFKHFRDLPYWKQSKSYKKGKAAGLIQ